MRDVVLFRSRVAAAGFQGDKVVLKVRSKNEAEPVTYHPSSLGWS